MNLRELAIKHGANKIWPLTQDYLPAYELHFGRFIHEPITLLEIGVEGGGSLKMWEEYFLKAMITGMDINQECAKYAGGRISIIIGDQGNNEFLEEFAKGKAYDIIIDDGSHQVRHQCHTFFRLWPSLKSGGFYVIEDLHTSYWPKWGGGLSRKGTTVEHVKEMVDSINCAAYSHEKAGEYRHNCKPFGIRSLHVYSGICFIEKE